MRTHYGNIKFAYDLDKEPVFRAVDVTRALGYEDSDQAIRTYVEEKYCIAVAYTKSSITELKPVILTEHQSNEYVLFGKGTWIRESGLYALLTRSKMPYARVFQAWLFEDVLPTLRRTGTYTMATPTLPVLTVSQEPEIENLTDFPALSVIQNAVYILECTDNDNRGYY